MTSFLYECLREVGLQRYYAQFSSLGLSHPAQLSKLTMSDYPQLGVHPMEDRTRLFYLVQVMKALDEEQNDECEDHGDYDEERGVMDFPTAPRRRLYFGPSSPESQLDILAEDCKTNTSVDESHTMRYAAQRDKEAGSCHTPVMTANQRRKACTSTETPKSTSCINRAAMGRHIYKDGETPQNRKTKKQAGCLKEMHRKVLMQQQSAPVYKVKHSQGYNYGLPNSSPVSSTRVARCGRVEFERIRVCVRKRPLSCSEERRGEADVVVAQHRDCVLISEKKEAVDLSQYVLQHEFYYDEVFSEACTNEDVYLTTARPLIQHIFAGGKATCFAYGQTGAGKTYTMLGSPQRPGLYALAGRDIFAQLGQSLSEPSVTKLPEAPLVFLSFFEIYCGQLYDLLDHRKRLFAREDQHHVVQIVGLREVMVDCVDNLLEVISCGSRERRQGASGVNCDSSRSHALLQIHLRDSKHQLIGRISFVDLAGSERAADTRKPDRQNRIEGAEINQSLLALKECIRALDQEHMHPPFRQSKLTQVLKDSFIGNSKTCMIANISPSHLATEHTLNTLRYADRVKELKKGNTNLLNPPTANSKYSDGPSPKLSKNKMEKSPLKKVRSGGYTTGIDDCFPASSPLRIEFPFADALLCSTPKFATEEKHHEQKGEVFLDHTTPVRGTLRNGMSKHSKELGKRWVAKGTKNNVGHYLKGSAKNAEQATKQSGEHEVQESICWKKLEQRFLLEEKFPGERDVHDIIKTKKDKLMDKREKNQNQDQDRWEEYQKVREKEETEAVKHLRRYHQQLQKLPYPPASLSGRLVQQTLADLVGMNKCVVQSPAVNRGTAIHTSPKITPVVWVGEDKNPTNNLCKDRLETDKVWCSRSSRQTIMTVWETKDCLSRGVIPEQILSRREESAEVTGSSQESSSSYQLDFSGYAGTREMLEQNGLFASRWAMLQGKIERLDVDKQESGGAQVPTICRTVDDLTFERLQLPAREESDSWEGEGEGMVQSNTYGLSKWSIEEECNGAWNTCDLSESSNGSSNVLAEKPLSSFIYKTLLNPEDHGNVSLDHKAVSHGVQDGLCTRDLHDTSDIPSYPLLRGNINSHEPSCSCSSDKVQIAGWMKGIQCIASAQGVETGPLFSSEVFPLGQASFVMSSEADAYGSPDAETEKGSQELKEIKGDAYSRAPLNIPQITSDNSTDTSTCSNTTMGPLSISLLDVERQAATDSIFQHDCSPLCNSVRERKEEGVEEEAPLFSSDAARGVNYSKSAVKLKGQTRHQWSFMDPSLLNGNSLETAAQHGGKVHSDPTVSIGVTHKQDYSPAKKVQVDLCREMVALEFAQDVDLLKQHAATSIDGFPCAGSPGASGNVGKVSNWDSSNAVHSSGVGLEKLVSDTSSRKAVLEDQVLKDGCLEEPLHSPRQDSAWLSCAASSHSENIMSAAEPNTALLCKTKLGEARRFVVQAHCEQLAKMELLCRREEALLSMQPNMDFNDYVLMLEEIMELQSQCVHSMRLQLDLYLTSRAQPSHTA